MTINFLLNDCEDSISLADPDVRLWRARGYINPDIRLGKNLICFPVAHVYFFVGGAKPGLVKT